MTRFFTLCIGAVLLALVINIGIAGAVDGEEIHADLNVSKIVSSTGPFETDDDVTWVVTLWNNGPGNATNITVAEDVSGLTGLHDLSASASLGDYNTTTNIWNITELKNATSATLTLTTNFSTVGNKENKVNITAFNETDLNPNDNFANATVQIKEKEITPPPGPTADLTISKMVSSTGPYNLDDKVTWVVTLRNKGPDNATNITVAEDISGLTGLQDLTAVASSGYFNTTTKIWNITKLENATSATLTLTTNFSTSGNKKNRVVVTDLYEMDPHTGDNSANATVQFNTTDSMPPEAPVSAKLVIRPTTLNLKSKGVFTVYVTIAGFAEKSPDDLRNKPRFDIESSSLICSGAEMIRASVSNKDGGTLIAKFHRNDLENVTPNEGVKINCSGTLVVNGKAINVEGNDTIRVIGEKKGLDKILSGLWKFLGVEKDDIEINETEDGNITVTLSLNPDNFKNPAQAKKTLKNQDNESAAGTDNETALSVGTQGGNEHPTKNNGNSKQLKDNNADKKPEKGNNDKNQRDEESNGKKNS